MTIEAGTRIGRYEIRRPLGAGGMGQVYAALDVKLDRVVALKLLPAEFASDQKRMQRFVQEARAASALNHPNIITIHEIEDTATPPFIATEFIDGETLRARLTRPLKLTEALDIVTQVASALSAAHAAGIVHRDIKPENIMVRRDGYVKVLDFGLAKLTERANTAADAEAPTKALVNTDPGAVMGTVNYMSPEQARGLVVDARTDIWSLGVVLYEMVAGCAPFAGETASDVIAAILGKEPPLLARYARDVSESLELIAATALTKDREERFHSVKEMLGALRRLKQRLDVMTELERSGTPEQHQVSTEGRNAERSAVETTQEPAAEASQKSAASTSQVAAAQTASSAEYIVSEIKRHKTGVVLASVAFVLIIIAAIFGLYKFLSREPSNKSAAQTPVAPASNMKISRLTTNGKVENAAISPDGKYVVYVVKDGGQRSLWLRQVATQSNVQTVAPAEVNYIGQTFSPDGNYIYYVVMDKGNPSGALYQVPVIGGATRKILSNIGSPVAFSPDGNRFAFVRDNEVASGEDQLMIANADGTNERVLAARKADSWFNYGGPSWSPDGKMIACSAGDYHGGIHEFVAAVDTETGTQREFTSQRFTSVGRVSWITDGSGLVFAAEEIGATTNQIWQLAYPGGEARKVTNDLNTYGPVSLTADSKTLMVVQGDGTSNVWVALNADFNHAKQITNGKLEGLSLAWTPDGKIVYSSLSSGHLDIWSMNGDGSNEKQLTNNAAFNNVPSVSPDGRFMVFVSYRAGFPSLWRMDIDGGNLKQLTNNQEDYFPHITPDGQWIIFDSWRSGKRAVWKISIDGGEPVQVSDKFSTRSNISPDGKLIAMLSKGEQPDAPLKILIIPFEGGEPVKSFDVPPTIDPDHGINFTPDGRAVTYVDGRSTPNLWSQPLDGGQPKQLTDFKENGVWQSAWSRDGRQMAITRGTVTKDVVLIKDFR